MSVNKLTPEKKADWYLAPLAWTDNLADVPGVFPWAKGFEIHRSHLPIVQHRSGVAEELARFEHEGSIVARNAKLGVTLRGYQHAPLDFAKNRRGVLIGDQMRLGKTPTSLAIFAERVSTPTAKDPLVIVAPLQTREVWTRWAKAFWPEIEPSIMKGRKYDPAALQGHPIVFIHYDILGSHHSLGLRPNTLIIDEIHLLQNAKSRRTQVALAWAAHSEQVIGLSGTPLWNRIGGVWPILAALNPGAWGTQYEFRQRYADPQMSERGFKYDGASNQEEFRARLTETMIARSWKDVMPELPPIERSIEVVDMAEDKIEAVEAAVADIRSGMRSVEAAQLAAFRNLVSLAKVPAACDVAKRFIDGGEAAVVWTWHRKTARAIAKRLARDDVPVFVVTGELDVDARDAVFAAWRAAPPGVLVCTMAVGQVGIDLSHARHAVFAELDFTPAVVAQAEMRTFDPSRPMTITYIIVEHPVDRRLVSILTSKVALSVESGLRAAEGSIEVIATAFGIDLDDVGDVDRLAGIFLSGGDDLAEAA